MQTRFLRLFLSGSLIALLLSACGNSVSTANAPTSDLVGTIVAATLSALTASASSPGPEAGAATPSASATASVSPYSSATPTFTPTISAATSTTPSGPQNSTVTTSTLCWLGPGTVYEVSSSIQKGTRVELLGRGDIGGWWVVRNPKYRDPCWMPDKYLQVDSGVNVSVMPIFRTPPTPTAAPTP
ncbi:MAG: hypothetical protein HYR70_11525 [Chloroflexi bacterium]|nr:hypothetical protein [Chloroflexota bacterium]MBI3339263.1 hypothetical protein [Chloroflexota bacterium]